MVQDHGHMVIDIPPKYSVAQIIGYVKGKTAIAVARQFGWRQRNFNGEKFWARGYAVKRSRFGSMSATRNSSMVMMALTKMGSSNNR